MTLTACPRAARGKWRVTLGRTLLSLALLAGFTHAQAATVIQSSSMAQPPGVAPACRAASQNGLAKSRIIATTKQ